MPLDASAFIGAWTSGLHEGGEALLQRFIEFSFPGEVFLKSVEGVRLGSFLYSLQYGRRFRSFEAEIIAEEPNQRAARFYHALELGHTYDHVAN